MRSTTALLVLFAQLFVLTAAHRDWWLKGLPKCWQSCFADTEDGCASSSCICNTSDDSSSYLPSAVSCAVSKCDADEWALELVLGPLDLLCRGIRCPIPKEVMDGAYAAASDSSSPQTPAPPPPLAPKPTRKPEHTSSANDDAPELMSTVRSTLTKTTTDSSGHTLQVIVPIAVGPSGIVTGSMSTSTLSGRPTTTGTPSTPSTSPQATSSPPELSLLPSSTAPPSSNGGGAGSNGSPFDVSAATGRSITNVYLSGLGATMMLFLAL